MKPILHFAHANGIPTATYEELLAHLSVHYEVITKPIFGLDPRFPVTKNWEYLVEELAESIRNQAYGRRVVAVGHSFGGLSSYLLAYKYPELLSGLIMIDPPLINGLQSFGMMIAGHLGFGDYFSPARQSKHRREFWHSKVEASTQLRTRGLFAGFTQTAFDAYIETGFIPSGVLNPDRTEGVKLTIPVKTEVEIFRTIPDYFWYKPRYAPLVPAHYIAAKSGVFFKSGFPQRLKSTLGIDYSVVDGGHMFPLDSPEMAGKEVHKQIQQLLAPKF